MVQWTWICVHTASKQTTKIVSNVVANKTTIEWKQMCVVTVKDDTNSTSEFRILDLQRQDITQLNSVWLTLQKLAETEWCVLLADGINHFNIATWSPVLSTIPRVPSTYTNGICQHSREARTWKQNLLYLGKNQCRCNGRSFRNSHEEKTILPPTHITITWVCVQEHPLHVQIGNT